MSEPTSARAMTLTEELDKMRRRMADLVVELSEVARRHDRFQPRETYRNAALNFVPGYTTQAVPEANQHADAETSEAAGDPLPRAVVVNLATLHRRIDALTRNVREFQQWVKAESEDGTRAVAAINERLRVIERYQSHMDKDHNDSYVAAADAIGGVARKNADLDGKISYLTESLGQALAHAMERLGVVEARLNAMDQREGAAQLESMVNSVTVEVPAEVPGINPNEWVDRHE